MNISINPLAIKVNCYFNNPWSNHFVLFIAVRTDEHSQ